MPLYTYVVCYDGRTFVDQNRKSNFKGFTATLIGRGPFYGELNIGPDLRQELTHVIARATWNSIPNREKVWQMEAMIRDKKLSMFAIETKS
jgi:hypothetical protein